MERDQQVRRKLVTPTVITIAAAWSLGGLSALFSTTGPALAQEQTPDADEGLAIEEIIVTSQKREGLLQDTPITIAVFTAQKLDDYNIENMETLQFHMPGLVIMNDLFATTFLRGIGSSPPRRGWKRRTETRSRA